MADEEESPPNEQKAEEDEPENAKNEPMPEPTPEPQEESQETPQDEPQEIRQDEQQEILQAEPEEITQEASPVAPAQVVGDSKEVRNSTNCRAICNTENLSKLPPKVSVKKIKSFADKNTEGPPGPDINGINPIQENLSLVLNAVKDLKLEVRPIPEPKSNQVLMQMEVVGICGSDVHYYVDGKIGHFVLDGPMVIGHEASGTVVKCGENVTSLKPGDRVAVEPQIPCRACEYCKSGKYNLCVNLFFCATPPDDGNLCRYYVHDADFCYKLPENMDFEDGCLMEPLSVGVHACTKLKITCGDYVLILGAGPIGLVTLLAGKAMGASKIIVTEIEEAKLKKALELGAHYVLNVSGMNEDDMIKNIHDKLQRAPNKTVDCSGAEAAIRAGIKATQSGGKFAAVGMGKDEFVIPYTDFLIREIDLLGSFRYVNNYPTAIDMVASGKINPKPLITHHFKMENAVKAFEMAANQEEPFIKIMIHTNPFWDPTGFLNKHASQMATPHKAPSTAQSAAIAAVKSTEAASAAQSAGAVPAAQSAGAVVEEQSASQEAPVADEASAEEEVPPAEDAPGAEEAPAEETVAEEEG